jgi:EpsI family protein
MRISKNTIGFVILIVMLLAAGTVSLNLFMREKTAHDTLDINRFPKVVDGWKGTDLEITEKEYDILETRNLISREYTNSSGKKLYLLIIYSETNRSVFHPPEVCLIGSGLDITDKQVEKFDAGGKTSTTNKLFAQKGAYKEIILNSYKAGNMYTSNFYLQQMRLAFHQIFGRNVPGATLRVSMVAGKDQAATLAILRSFLSKSAVILDRLTG